MEILSSVSMERTKSFQQHTTRDRHDTRLTTTVLGGRIGASASSRRRRQGRRRRERERKRGPQSNAVSPLTFTKLRVSHCAL